MENKEDLLMSYIAGLIDGDGSISLIRESRATGFKYHPCIQLSNVFEGMIDLLYQTFGGCKKIKSRQLHAKKTQYVWNVRGLESCKNVLEKIIPYVVLKKKQCEKLLKFVCDPSKYNPEMERMEIQGFNNDSLTLAGNVCKQARKNSIAGSFWAYFSGIIDTEGSFSVKKGSPSWGCKNYRYTPMIQLTMASFDTMNFIRKNFCFGRVCFPKATCTQRGFTYKLMIVKANECVEMINQMLPYLVFKKEAALELLNFCKNVTVVRHKQKGVSDEELEFRDTCYQKIKQINESGIVKPSLIDSEALKLGDEGQAGKPCSLND